MEIFRFGKILASVSMTLGLLACTNERTPATQYSSMEEYLESLDKTFEFENQSNIYQIGAFMAIGVECSPLFNPEDIDTLDEYALLFGYPVTLDGSTSPDEYEQGFLRGVEELESLNFDICAIPLRVFTA